MAERKKRGLGRGLGALIPDAASNDRPVDVFFSGGDAEDTRDSSSEETKRPRAARTDPAASMQSSRRRKAKSGTNTTGSPAKTASESSVEKKRAPAPNSSSNKTTAAGTGEPSASKTAKATPAKRTAKTAANNSTEEKTSGSRAATGTASKAAAGAKKSTAAKSTAAKTSGSKTSGTKTSGTETSDTQATAGKTDSRSAGSKASSSNTETNSDAEAPRAGSTSPDAKAASTSKSGAEHSDARSADGSESVAAAVEASETEPKAQAPETDFDSDSADENAAARQNGSDGVYETHPGVYTSGSDDPDREEAEEQYDDSETTEVVDTSVSDADEGAQGLEGVDSIPDTEFGEIDVDRIEANPRQPRTVFDEDMLAELVHSIREIGVLQPVVVRQKPNEAGRYELIMGERRLRATKDAGLATIPAIIRYVDDTDLLRDALLENLHRAELNPLEEAAAYGQLLEDFGCTQEELSERIGRSRPQISNTLRLLRLPPLVQRRVAAGVISAGHARAILGLREPEHMEILAQRIVAEGLSVRASEEAVVLLNRGDSVNVSRGTSRVSPEFIEVAERLGDRLDTKVNITVGKRKGKLSVEFANQEDLDRILTLLGVTEAAE